ncbi:MAG: type II toxin-antitoxin system RelE/ParE family toxin [Balneolaceae bacterium]|nr:type II toxin-antitoxin system RelE/ParE family toxin [Balneolaceae bacterium]
MIYKIHVSSEAELDLQDSYNWYESKVEGLGEKFLSHIDRNFETIASNPFAYAVRFRSFVRAYVMPYSPYLILYIITEESIKIIAVFHTRLNPIKLKDRLA